MRRLLVVSLFLAVLLLSLASLGSASELNWRLHINTDNGAGGYGMMGNTVGIKAGCKDPQPTDALPLSDAGYDASWTAILSTTKAVGFVFPADTAGTTPRAWSADVKSTNQPWSSQYYDPAYAPSYHRKVWELRVAGCGTADTLTPIRLRVNTVSAQYLPSQTLTRPDGSKVACIFGLKMVNNRGKAGAPANGTIWAVPIPTVHSSTSSFALTLPTINISVAKNEQALLNEGYIMEFFQTYAVPEPSSMLALAGGLMALAGYASRRRRK